MVAVIEGIGDAGRMPGQMKHGNKTMTVRDDETIVDPVGSRPLARMFNWFERNVTRGGFGDVRGAQAGGDGGPMLFQVNLDGRTIAEVAGKSMYDMSRSGQGVFTKEAFA